MLLSRIVPFLLVQDGGLVKTVQFRDGKYVGDPLNAVKIFNEKRVDELVVLDINASRNGQSPNMRLVEDIASQCRMPLCYGGGVKSVAEVEEIISLGVEKVAIGSEAVLCPELVEKAAARVGSQSISVVLDIKKTGVFTKKNELFISNGAQATGLSVSSFAANMEERGAGEIIINSIDRDGTCRGYDVDLVEEILSSVSLPVTVVGGAGSYDDLSNLSKSFGVIGIGAGSIFVFKGKHRAVLIQYPNSFEKKQILNS
jgi:cyclase